MKKRFAFLFILAAFVMSSIAVAADPLSPGGVAASPEKYLNKKITVFGVVSGFTNSNKLKYDYMYTLNDDKGSLIVYVKNAKSMFKDGDKKEINGTLMSEDGAIFLEQGGKIAIPLWVYIVGGVLVVVLVVVIALITKSSKRDNAYEEDFSTIASVPQRGFCDQCGQPLNAMGSCPNCSAKSTDAPGVTSGTVSVNVAAGKGPSTVLISQATAKAILALKDGSTAKTNKLDLTAGSKKIGRNQDCDFVINDETVSGEHAKVIEEGGKFFIHDVGSTNGTYVNGEKVVKQELNDGDEVRLGKAELKFTDLSSK